MRGHAKEGSGMSSRDDDHGSGPSHWRRASGSMKSNDTRRSCSGDRVRGRQRLGMSVHRLARLVQLVQLACNGYQQAFQRDGWTTGAASAIRISRIAGENVSALDPLPGSPDESVAGSPASRPGDPGPT